MRQPFACTGCGTVLPAEANFCFKCGRAQSGTAEPAGSPKTQPPTPDPRSYTPRHLAEKILTSRSVLHGERKQVTVLFADVKESLELAGRVDPERWHAILDQFFAILCEGVHRFEGTINQFTGDGIMALFGAPIAHEDHAQRACHAALYLAAALRRYSDELRLTEELNFAVRMGLNAGDVVVGAIGDDLRMDYTAQGHTVGLAARMEQIAEPGRIYVTEHVVKLTAGFFRFRDLGPLEVKGVADPVRVYELEGVGPLRTRLDASRARGFSRFVGRAKELAKLEAALARAGDGPGRVIAIVAEPGVGKSRLCHEFAERCRARGIAVRRAQGVAHGRMIPFLPVSELLRSYFGIREEDGADEARRKIAGTLLLIDKGLDSSLALVFEFLGVPVADQSLRHIDPEARQRQLFAVMKQLVRAPGPVPAVILLEDLHWIDGGTAAYLEPLMDAALESHTLFVVNFRPEYDAPWMHRLDYESVALRPLGRAAARELLGDLLGGDPALQDLAESIRQRTGGNPFFIEEAVQSLLEGGQLAGAKGAYRLVKPAREVEMPASVQAILAARIDRLPDREKRVLQVAAVIGKRFSEPVLRRVLDERTVAQHDRPDRGGESATAEVVDLDATLRRLREAEFIYEEASHPEAEYTFKHPLTQEVAYRSQLAEHRRVVHQTVAQVMERLHGDHLDAVAALLAHHWEEAGDRLRAAQWTREAAEWAGRSDVAEAARHWRHVRTLIHGQSPSPETNGLGIWASLRLLNLGWRVGLTDRDAAALFEEGKALARSVGRPDALIGMLDVYGIVRGMAGDVDEALGYVTEGTRLADESGDAALRVASRVALAQARYMNGALCSTLEAIDTALHIAGEDAQLGAQEAGLSPYAFLTMYRGAVLVDIGPIDAAARQLERALTLARELGEEEIRGWTHDFYAQLAQHSAEPRAGLAHAREAIEVAERIGNSFSRAAAYFGLGCVHLRLEEWHEAAEVLEAALTMVRELRTGLHLEPGILARLGHAQCGLGEMERARVTVREAVALAQRRNTRLHECVACIILARVLRQSEGLTLRDDIEGALARALMLVGATGARCWEPPARVELAELARLSGDKAAAERELREAQRLYADIGAGGQADTVTVARR